MDAKGSETTSSDTRTETLEAVYGSIFVEYDTGNGFSIGADIMPYSVGSNSVLNERRGGTTGTEVHKASGKTVASVDIKDNVMLYAIKPLNDSVYIKAGFSQADLITEETMASSTNYPNATLEGMHLSLGTAIDTGQGVTLRAEAGYSDYDDVSVTSDGGTGANTVTVSELSGPHVRISLVKAF